MATRSEVLGSIQDYLKQTLLRLATTNFRIDSSACSTEFDDFEQKDFDFWVENSAKKLLSGLKEFPLGVELSFCTDIIDKNVDLDLGLRYPITYFNFLFDLFNELPFPTIHYMHPTYSRRFYLDFANFVAEKCRPYIRSVHGKSLEELVKDFKEKCAEEDKRAAQELAKERALQLERNRKTLAASLRARNL